jgi:hypothetical protein
MVSLPKQVYYALLPGQTQEDYSAFWLALILIFPSDCGINVGFVYLLARDCDLGSAVVVFCRTDIWKL